MLLGHPFWGCLRVTVGSVDVLCSARHCCRGRAFKAHKRWNIYSIYWLSWFTISLCIYLMYKAASVSDPVYHISNDVYGIIFLHFWYLSNFTCILKLDPLGFICEWKRRDALKRTNIGRVLHWPSSIWVPLEHPFEGMSPQKYRLGTVSKKITGGPISRNQPHP